MSHNNPHHLLYNNLRLLHELKPGNSEFVKCIKENMFVKPNRTAFDQVLFYLCSTYDSASYLPKVPWPILDRSQERTFRQNTVTFVKEIIKDVPKARLPPFAHSFLSTPGGDRLAKFMWKFSLLVLKTVVEKESDFVVLQYPTIDLHLIENLTEMTLEEVGRDVNELCQLMIDASNYAQIRINVLEKYTLELRNLRSDLTDTVQLCPLSNHEKSLLLENGQEHFKSVIKNWQERLNTGTSEAKTVLKTFQDQSKALKMCYESVKLFVNSKHMPIVLDARSFPSNLKDDDGNLNLADVLSEGALAASALLNSISMFGGLQSLTPALSVLEDIKSQLQEVKESLTESKNGFIEIISSSLESMISPQTLKETPPSKSGLQLGHEMLQDVQVATPPLVFNVPCDGSSFVMETDSPPVEGVVRKMKPSKRNSHLRTAVDTCAMGTPKSHKPSAISACSVMQTPAVLCSNTISTSTAFKLTANGNKDSNHVSISKMSSLGAINKPSQCQLSSSGRDQDSISPIPIEPVPSVVLFREEIGVKNIPFEENIKTSVLPEVGSEKNKDDTRNKTSFHSPPRPTLSVSEKIRQNHPSKFVAGKAVLGKAVLGKAVRSNSLHDLTFDSPESSSFGIFSPGSVNGSFLSNDTFLDNPVLSDPKFGLDFEEDISPSGRVSMCLSSEVPDTNVVEETNIKSDQLAVPEVKTKKRKSLLAIINRYHEIVASSKIPIPVHVSPPLSPEPDILTDDLDINIDMNLDDINLD